ncbi:MAG TPA: mycofactocin precursor MftA [Streptosporangiaceae bacterium]
MSEQNPGGEAVAVADDVDDTDELLVEEISIDGLCGVY